MAYKSLPNSSLVIAKMLSEGENLSIEDIRNRSELNNKQVRYGIKRLRNAGLIISIPDLLDMRTVKYRLANSEEIERAGTNPVFLNEVLEVIRK